MQFNLNSIDKKLIEKYKQSRVTGQLNLQGQELSQFPDAIIHFSEINFNQKWWELQLLQKLDLSNNFIVNIPSEFGLSDQQQLQTLRLSNNKINMIPSSFFSLPSLKNLDLSHNDIQIIPQEINMSQFLVELNLSYNQIKEFPPNFSLLNQLESYSLTQFNNKLKLLNLQCNKLQLIKKNEIGQQLNQLKELNLSENLIEQIECDSLSRLESLVLLDLRQNKLKIFNESPNSKSLDTLILSFNQLTQLQNIEKNSSLTVLDLKNNKLQSLGFSINFLICLKTLDISNNDFKDLPNEIGLLKQLIRINIEGNPLKTIKQSIKAAGANILKQYLNDRIPKNQNQTLIQEQNEEQSQIFDWKQLIRQYLCQNTLELKGLNLQIMGDPIFELKNLQILNLIKNKIQQIPEKCQQLENLNIINLHDNQIQILPSSLIKLKQLKILDMSKNKINAIEIRGQAISNSLCYIQELYLQQNQLADIQEFFMNYQMSNLRIVNISFNQIQTIDILFSKNVPSLEIADASNNKILQIPQELKFYQNQIQHLNLSNNDIKNFGWCLGWIESLKSLQILGNPQKIIPQNIVLKGNLQLLQYIKQNYSNQQALNEEQKTNIQQQNVQIPILDIQQEINENAQKITDLNNFLNDNNQQINKLKKQQLRREVSELQSIQLKLQFQITQSNIQKQ